MPDPIEIPDELLPPLPPYMMGFMLEGEIRSAASIANGALSDLRTMATACSAAVLLMEFAIAVEGRSLGPQLATEWQFLAGRDCAMSIYNFDMALAVLRRSLRAITPWNDLVDWKALSQAGKDMTRSFPVLGRMRNVVAHSAEHYATPEKLLEHTAKLTGIGHVQMKQVLVGRTLQYSDQGKIISLPIDRRTALQLLAIYERIISAISHEALIGPRMR